jgi:hypothetical protein
LILGAARRSLRCTDTIILGNGTVLSRENSEFEISKVTGMILNLIVNPLRDIQINDHEFSCLKAIVFFDPDSRGISDPVLIKKIRSQIQINLEDYVNEERLYDSRGRFGEMLLLLPTLHNLAQQVIEIIQYFKHFGSTNIDSLLNEMLLGNVDINPSQPTNVAYKATNPSMPEVMFLVKSENTNASSSQSSDYSDGIIQYNQKQQYLTIRQDPYPPISSSPEFLDTSNTSCFSNNNIDSNLPSIIDCIEMNNDNAFTRDNNNYIKKEELYAVNDIFNQINN